MPTATEIVTAFGNKILNYFLMQTKEGDKFILAIDDFSFNNLAKIVINDKKINQEIFDKALRNIFVNGYLYNVQICIAISALQVNLIYQFDNFSTNSFYKCLNNYNPSFFSDDSTIEHYLRNYQDDIWESVYRYFLKYSRKLFLPVHPQAGPGRYVKYPNAQYILSKKQLIGWAGQFIRLNIISDQVFSFFEFCNLVFPSRHPITIRPSILYLNYELQQELARRFIFSFYCQWDGHSSSDIRQSKGKIGKSRQIITWKREKKTIIARIENEKIKFYRDNNEKIQLKTHFDIERNLNSKKSLFPFIYDEKYNDWVYGDFLVTNHDRILVLDTAGQFSCTNLSSQLRPEYSCSLYYTYIFDECSKKIADLSGLRFIPEKVFFPIGGIRVKGVHYNSANLGSWHDFALPQIKIETDNKHNEIYIDSTSVEMKNEILDLNSLINKSTKHPLELRCGEHSIKAYDTTEAFFTIVGVGSEIQDKPLVSGWLISPNTVRQAKEEKEIALNGLNILSAICKGKEFNAKVLRPFLQRDFDLKKSLPLSSLNNKIQHMEKRKHYGH
jgi:hypothetical protein